MFFRTASLFASLSILSHGLAANALQPLPASAPLPDTLPGLVSRRIQLDMAERLNVSAQDIVVNKATPQTWSDHCLELAGPEESCVQGMKKGWQVEVKSPQQNWTYRSDRTAANLRLEPLASNANLPQADFSTTVSQTLLSAVSQQIQYPAEDLQVAQVQAVTWNSCLGLSSAEATCDSEAIPGFKVIVTEEANDSVSTLYRITQQQGRAFRREWVYHLSADATQIEQNTTASDLSGRVNTWLSRPSSNFEPIDDTVIFQSIVDTYPDSSQLVVTLTDDGTLAYEYYRRGEKVSSETAYRQVSTERVDFFKTLLEQQNFSDFDQMGYGNEDYQAAVDSGIVIRTPDAVVRVSAQEKDLPRSLRVFFDALVGFAF